MASELGRALAAIHELPKALVQEANLPSYGANEFRQRKLNELDQAATTGRIPSVLLRRWEHALEDVTLWRFSPTVVHGDLHEDHLLISGSRVSAVTGWTDLRIGDPADDFAWLAAVSDPGFVDGVYAAYNKARGGTVDQHLARRAALAAEFALAQWMVRGLAMEDPQMIAEAQDMMASLEADVKILDQASEDQRRQSHGWNFSGAAAPGSPLKPAGRAVPSKDHLQEGGAEARNGSAAPAPVQESVSLISGSTGVPASTDAPAVSGGPDEVGGPAGSPAPSAAGPADSSGRPDSGSPDPDSSDAGSSDTGPSNSAPSDTGSSDTASSDTGSSDTGPSDTDPSDTASSGAAASRGTGSHSATLHRGALPTKTGDGRPAVTLIRPEGSQPAAAPVPGSGDDDATSALPIISLRR
jgi:hypothetical protein